MKNQKPKTKKKDCSPNRWRWALYLFLILNFSFSSLSLAAVRVVASTTDLAAIAREVGGDLVQVESLCRGDQDPHEFEILPTQVTTIQQADLYLKVGLALDSWADKLIAGAGNSHLQIVDCSQNIAVLGKSPDHSGPHPQGNPHYWLAPTNFSVIAGTIRDGLKSADAVHAAEYDANFAAFSARADSAYSHWKEVMASCRGNSVVTEHASWDYFVRDFEMKVAGIVNKIPEAEPTPMDLALLEQTIRTQKVSIYLREPFEGSRIPEVLARDTGIKILLAPTSVGGLPGSQDVWSHFDALISLVAGACASPR